ncbi:MAG: shikimate kinase [Rhizobiales bacterium PAR1]|nr:MAG: shikimate kinase [Rhizobiales bacterium PAR1]
MIDAPAPVQSSSPSTARLLEKLRGRHIVLVGLMGAGKTSVGKRLAQRLGLPFVDSDHAIEESARMTIPEIFAERGETEFRAGERKVIARLLGERQQVIATGGGAYMDAETRARVREQAVSLWLNAELPTLMRRVQRRQNRPLLQGADPEATMRELMERRYPVYAEANASIMSQEVPHELMVQAAVDSLLTYLDKAEPASDTLKDAAP